MLATEYHGSDDIYDDVMKVKTEGRRVNEAQPITAGWEAHVPGDVVRERALFDGGREHRAQRREDAPQRSIGEVCLAVARCQRREEAMHVRRRELSERPRAERRQDIALDVAAVVVERRLPDRAAAAVIAPSDRLRAVRACSDNAQLQSTPGSPCDGRIH